MDGGEKRNKCLVAKFWVNVSQALLHNDLKLLIATRHIYTISGGRTVVQY